MARIDPRYAIWAALALVAITLGLSLAKLTWRLAGETGVTIAPVNTPRATGGGEAGIEPIIALAPFGDSMRAAPAPGEATEETSLGLVLHGVAVSADASKSQALIGEEGGEVEIYRIDDGLPGGAQLNGIFEDHVVLLVSGRLETLSFPKVEGGGGGGAAGVAAMRARLPASVTGRTRAEVIPETRPADEVIDDYRKRIAANPQTVMDELGVSATPDGYRIGENAAPEVRRAGLQPGDIVVQVNGHAVGNIESDRALYDQIAASGQARVEVMRGERRLVLSFPLH